MARYFLDDTDYLYFHSYMSDYFLGTYGGGGFAFLMSTYFVSGILKPFRYTEIQKHTFHLKSKDDNKDRQAIVLLYGYIRVSCCSGACYATGLLQQTGKVDQVLILTLSPMIALTGTT